MSQDRDVAPEREAPERRREAGEDLAGVGPDARGRVAPILALQRSAGNAAVSRLISRAGRATDSVAAFDLSDRSTGDELDQPGTIDDLAPAEGSTSPAPVSAAGTPPDDGPRNGSPLVRRSVIRRDGAPNHTPAEPNQSVDESVDEPKMELSFNGATYALTADEYDKAVEKLRQGLIDGPIATLFNSMERIDGQVSSLEELNSGAWAFVAFVVNAVGPGVSALAQTRAIVDEAALELESAASASLSMDLPDVVDAIAAAEHYVDQAAAAVSAYMDGLEAGSAATITGVKVGAAVLLGVCGALVPFAAGAAAAGVTTTAALSGQAFIGYVGSLVDNSDKLMDGKMSAPEALTEALVGATLGALGAKGGVLEKVVDAPVKAVTARVMASVRSAGVAGDALAAVESYLLRAVPDVCNEIAKTLLTETPKVVLGKMTVEELEKKIYVAAFDKVILGVPLPGDTAKAEALKKVLEAGKVKASEAAVKEIGEAIASDDDAPGIGTGGEGGAAQDNPYGPSSVDAPADGAGGAPAHGGEIRRQVIRRDAKQTGIERIREIHKNWWVGPLDEYELQDEWSKLGSAGAKQYPSEFATSINRGMEPNKLKGAENVIADFRSAVLSMANRHLDGNLRDLAKEEEAIGLGPSVAPGAEPSDQQKAKLAELQSMAERVGDLERARAAHRDILVGYDPVPGELRPKRGGAARPATEEELAAEAVTPVTFDPGYKPMEPRKPGDPGASWEDVAASYAEVSGTLMAVANQHPVLYAALKSGKVDEIAGGQATDEAAADPREAIRSVLASTRAAIEETRGKVGGDLGYEKFKPLHAQLLRGEEFSGNHDWTHPWNKAIVQDEIGAVENVDMAVDVGIGMMAALAFIFAEVASGGTATVLFAAGLGLGASQVARKYDDYDTLKTAASAGTSKATELIEQGQVDAALLDLVLEAAFSFLDVAGVAVKGAKAAQRALITSAGAKAAEKGAGAAALRGIASMGAEEAAEAAGKTIDHLGVKAAADAANMTPQQLLNQVGASSAAGKRIAAYLEVAAKGVEPGRLQEAIAAVLKGDKVAGKTGAELGAEEVIGQAIEELGVRGTLEAAGGWKPLASALGPKSGGVGDKFKAWRDAVYHDLNAFIESLRLPEDGSEALVRETGSRTNVTNDLDISFLGPRASERKAKAAQFLGGRTGFGADPNKLDKMVYIGLFTDPRRMHLFDQFPELQAKLAQRTMKVEEELIWNDEWRKWLLNTGKHDAAYAKQMAEEIGAQMDSLGVRRRPDLRPLSDRAAEVLNKGQDELHAAIEEAVRSGDMAKAEGMIEQLATVQAQINIKEGGGYFSAGGVRQFVTERENFPGRRLASTASHDLGAVLDQVGKLREAVAKFEAQAVLPPASREPADLAKAIKDISKYGDRFTSAASVIGKEIPNASTLEDVARRFEVILASAGGELTRTVQERLAADAEQVIGIVRTTCDRFSDVHLEVLRALRERAGIQGVPDLTDAVLKANTARYRFLTFKSMLVTQMGAAARAAGLVLELTEEKDEEPATAQPERAPTGPGDYPLPADPNAPGATAMG